MRRADILTVARSMLGTPFMHQGRLPGVALDCAGLVIAVARQLGIDHTDVAGYGRRPHLGLLDETLDNQSCLAVVAPAEALPGDILLMRFAKEPQHLAIYAGQTIIHSWEAPGKVVEHGLDAIWSNRIVRVYRFTGVES